MPLLTRFVDALIFIPGIDFLQVNKTKEQIQQIHIHKPGLQHFQNVALIGP